MKKENLEDLDQLITQIRAEADDEDGQLWVFRRIFGEQVKLLLDGWVIGEPVRVIEIDYKGNPRRGLTALVRRADGSEYTVSAADVTLLEGSTGARYLDAYRRWLGLDPYPTETGESGRVKRSHKVETEDIDLDKSVDLIVLSVKQRMARCRLPGSERVITFRPDRMLDLVPGWIVTVKPLKRWSYARHPYLSGEIESFRLDIPALDLIPLRLTDMGLWDPQGEYWGEPGEPIEDWAKPIIEHGPRRQFEMEQVLPGCDFDIDDPFSDPITESNTLKEGGDIKAARRIPMDLCQADLRYLDAHAHLGNLLFESFPQQAIPHYETGVRIGELSLDESFEGLLPWGHIDNRPFLRCLHGYGLCLWRLERRDEATQVFDRLLWISPADNLGVRFLIRDVSTGKKWEEVQ
jgi:tetratricopeptide (TPR) repeat protein